MSSNDTNSPPQNIPSADLNNVLGGAGCCAPGAACCVPGAACCPPSGGATATNGGATATNNLWSRFAGLFAARR